MKKSRVKMKIEEDYEDDLMIEEAKILRKEIMQGNKKYPEDMFCAFCAVLYRGIEPEYKEFIKDLEIDESDKLLILKGMLEKKVENFWGDLESVIDFGGKILSEFKKYRTDKERKAKAIK
jgi:hypothetical protein